MVNFGVATIASDTVLVKPDHRQNINMDRWLRFCSILTETLTKRREPWWSETAVGHQSTERWGDHEQGTRPEDCDDSWETKSCYSVVTWRCRSVPECRGTAAPVPEQQTRCQYHILLHITNDLEPKLLTTSMLMYVCRVPRLLLTKSPGLSRTHKKFSRTHSEPVNV